MLKRIRIDVKADTPGQVELELTKYEQVMQLVEVDRFNLYRDSASAKEARLFAEHRDDGVPRLVVPAWAANRVERDFYNDELGREITDEVIQLESPGTYVGRRVVQFRRLDGRIECGNAVRQVVVEESVAADGGLVWNEPEGYVDSLSDRSSGSAS